MENTPKDIIDVLVPPKDDDEEETKTNVPDHMFK